MDSSSKEQLSLVLRFVDGSNNLKEKFVGFIYLKDGRTGKAISDAIIGRLTELSLDISRWRGQGYDEDGKNKRCVAGSQNGASAHILRINRKALLSTLIVTITD